MGGPSSLMMQRPVLVVTPHKREPAMHITYGSSVVMTNEQAFEWFRLMRDSLYSDFTYAPPLNQTRAQGHPDSCVGCEEELRDAKKGRIRRLLVDLWWLLDSVNLSAVRITTVLMGFITTLNFGTQGYKANIPLAWCLFRVSTVGIVLSCLLAYTPIPLVVQCIKDVAKEDKKLNPKLHRLKAFTEKVDAE